MIRRYRNISLALGVPGLVLQVAGLIQMRLHPMDAEYWVVSLLGTFLLFLGAVYHMRAKGRHLAWSLLAYFSVIGVIILACLEDLTPQERQPAAEDFDYFGEPLDSAERAAFWMLGARFLASLILGLALVVALAFFFGAFGLMAVMFLGALYAWVLYTFFQYRYLRQNEVVYLLATAAEAQQPLAPAVWAYLVDRPHSSLREFVVALFLSVVYWGWYRRNTFDHKVRRLAVLLESGMPLHQALRAVPGVVPREAALAAAVGQATGQLASCLRRVPQWRLATVWLELVPRFLYPVLVLLIMYAIVTFQMIFIVPKFEKIYADFRMKLPPATEFFIGFFRWMHSHAIVPLAILLGVGAVTVLVFNRTVRWYFPVLGRFYRLHVQSRALKMLGLLLETGQTVPQALNTLASAGYFRGPAVERLRDVRQQVEQGQPLADELQRKGLMAQAMVPLLHAAEKARNLPWALAELGEHLARRTIEKAQRLAMTLFPLTIVAVGLFVGFVVLSLFLPLLHLMNSLEGTLHR